MESVKEMSKYIFQFTPLREGRLHVVGQNKKVVGISIHAPAGGATGNGKKRYTEIEISIHAPAGGAT